MAAVYPLLLVHNDTVHGAYNKRIFRIFVHGLFFTCKGENIFFYVQYSSIYTILTACVTFVSVKDNLLVRYHCGGRPEEVNSCVLNSYMVYL
jgi:hypothetical protein